MKAPSRSCFALLNFNSSESRQNCTWKPSPNQEQMVLAIYFAIWRQLEILCLGSGWDWGIQSICFWLGLCSLIFHATMHPSPSLEEIKFDSPRDVQPEGGPGYAHNFTHVSNGFFGRSQNMVQLNSATPPTKGDVAWCHKPLSEVIY